MELKHRVIRTLALLRQMAQGKHLTLQNGERIGMSNTMVIGFVISIKGKDSISPLSEMTLRQLDEICEQESIGPIIPVSPHELAMEEQDEILAPRSET